MAAIQNSFLNPKWTAIKQPPKTLPRSPGNEREWLDACKGGKVKPGGNFEFEGLVTETLAPRKRGHSNGTKAELGSLELEREFRCGPEVRPPRTA